MVRVRKLVLAIAAASAFSSGTANALGLGEVTLKSSLSQPLVAEIELLEVRDLNGTEVIPALASADEFSKAGVERDYFLTDLKFTPVINAKGRSVIRVTSSKPVREPYLNFLVEVLWPNGRLLREYTLLLDPPTYSPQTVTAAAPQAPVAAPRRTPAPAPQAARPAAPAPAAAPVAPRATPSAKPAASDQYRTTSRDTLWEIAQRNRQGGSVHQAMLAIQELNPDAFVDGNINRLKSGQVLRLPTEQQIASRSQSEALTQVAAQNSAWRQGRNPAAASGARQLDATKRSSAGDAPARAEVKDNLKLVAPGNEKAGNTSNAGDVKALNDQLAVTKESLDSTRRENEELKSRMGDLQSQLDKVQKLIALKDGQLAKLQADMAAQGKAVPAAPEVPAQPVATPAPGDAAPAAAKPAPAPVEGAVEAEPAEPDESKPEAALPAAKPAPVEKPADKPAAAKPASPKPAPVQPAEPVAEPSFLDDLLANPMLLAAGGGVVLLGLIGLLIGSRRKAAKEERQAFAQDGGDDSGDTFSVDLSDQSDSFSGLDLDKHEEEFVAPRTADALGEADIYIAYGKFNQAAELLHNAINDEPQRTDLRLKLMEVYAELGDRDGFTRQEQELREIGGAAAEVEQLKSRYPAMVAAALVAGAATLDDLDSFSLDDLTLDDSVAAAPAAPAAIDDLDDAFDLSLDELDKELAEKPGDLGDFTLDPLVPQDSAADDLDFDLELGEEEALAAGAENLPAADLPTFSLDLPETESDALLADDDFLLSLDEPKAEPAAADLGLPDDFDLSLPEEPAVAEPQADSFAAQLDEVSAELDQLGGDFAEASALDDGLDDLDEEFDFLSGTDESATKLDLARAYIDMGDTEGARDILDEVAAEGNESQQQEARELIAKLV
ncbi:FimV/HubP family polar landmark protein [Pseudomonas sp. LRF_L74]|uniref:FimV/HubP family polar landmark protein n=1 Tax=Pseudomonas sp. LRF_L74 TaxID=3369422 RepID=UPI003F62F05A